MVKSHQVSTHPYVNYCIAHSNFLLLLLVVPINYNPPTLYNKISISNEQPSKARQEFTERSRRSWRRIISSRSFLSCNNIEGSVSNNDNSKTMID